MTPHDLADLHARAFTATRAWSAEEFAGLLGQRGVFVTGATGCFAVCRVTADEAEILTIATDPALRRTGMASAALRAAETGAATLGAVQMFLEVAENNDAACAFYAKASYRQVGRRPGYYTPKDAPPVAALVLRKSLTAR